MKTLSKGVRMRFLSGFRGVRRPAGACFALWVSILISAFFCGGCGKGGGPSPGPGAGAGPAVSPAETNRPQDAAYVAALREQGARRTRIVAGRNRALARMRVIEERVRGSLPKDAPEERVAAACREDPAWAGLEAERRAGDEAIERQAAEIRTMIHDRMARESRRRRELEEKPAEAPATPGGGAPGRGVRPGR